MSDVRNLTPIGRAICLTGCVRLYRDGGAVGNLFRWWHPMTWLIWVITLQWCGIVGEKVSDVVPLRLPEYWRKRRNEIEWL